jgi:hypothetical protein
LLQTSDNPYTVTLQNLGEKKTRNIINLRMTNDAIKIGNLLSSEAKDALPDKYVFKHNGLLMGTHRQVIKAVVLPYFLDTALVAVSKNKVAVQWLFVSILASRLASRLDVPHTWLNSKFFTTSDIIAYPFTTSDIAYTYAECIRLCTQNDFPRAVIDLLQNDFMQLPEMCVNLLNLCKYNQSKDKKNNYLQLQQIQY